VAQQEQDPDSILNFYKKAIALRKALPVVRHGKYVEFFPGSDTQFVYSREMAGQKLLVICSFSDREQPLKLPAGFDIKKAELILANYEKPADTLRPYECRVYKWEN
jgi:oligo-1,6-glucosidase